MTFAWRATRGFKEAGQRRSTRLANRKPGESSQLAVDEMTGSRFQVLSESHCLLRPEL